MVSGWFLLSIYACLFALVKTANGMFYLGINNQAKRDDYSEHFIATREKCNKFNYLKSNCLIPSKNGSSQTILLIGDSHAGHLIPLLGEVFVNSELCGFNPNTAIFGFLL